MKRSISVFALVMAMLAPAFTPTARATVMVELPRARLVEGADLIVEATVGAQHSAWNENHTQIITLSEIRVQRYLKGNGPNSLTVRQLGGTMDGRTMHIAGNGDLHAQDHVFLFLRRGPGVVYLSEMAQSLYTIDHGQVHRDISEVTFVELGEAKMRTLPQVQERPETVTHFVNSVRGFVRGGK